MQDSRNICLLLCDRERVGRSVACHGVKGINKMKKKRKNNACISLGFLVRHKLHLGLCIVSLPCPLTLSIANANCFLFVQGLVFLKSEASHNLLQNTTEYITFIYGETISTFSS